LASVLRGAQDETVIPKPCGFGYTETPGGKSFPGVTAHLGRRDIIAGRARKSNRATTGTWRAGPPGIGPAILGSVQHAITASIEKEETIMRSIIHYANPPSTGLWPSFDFAARSPWAGLENEIDRLFGTALSDFMTPAFDHRFPVDLYEDKENTYVRAELPGVSRDAINVEMVDGYLTINASRKTLTTEGNGEESFSFSRSVSIPEDVPADKVSAAYENGVLTVTLPKKEEAKPRKITVAVN
jgi:HSP20 family protein